MEASESLEAAKVILDHHLTTYCYVSPGKPAYSEAVARQHLRKYATILQPLLGSRPLLTMKPRLEGVFYVVRADAISRQLPVVRYSWNTETVLVQTQLSIVLREERIISAESTTVF
jgi:hypothetical protein